MKKILQLLFIGMFLSLNLSSQEILFVTESGAGDNSGGSWDNAMPGTQLQDAIDALESSGGEVWVAAGTYLPQKTTGTLYRCITGDKSFELKTGVALYGGFAPADGVTDMELRDPKTYETILSGDFNGDDSDTFDQYEPAQTREDNTTHVIVASGVDDSSVLDGFVVTGGEAYNGNSDLSTCYYNRGGGLFVRSQVDYDSVDEERKHGPVVRNCCFRNNMASYGGAVFVWHGEEYEAEQYFVIEDNEFVNNYALMGGAIYSTDNSENYISQPSIKNNVFKNNYAKFYGGAVHIGGRIMFHSYSDYPSFTHVTTIMQREINAVVRGNVFAFNESGYCGAALSMAGVGYEQSTLFLEGNSFLGNEAANGGGGCYLFAFDDYKSDGKLDVGIYNNVFANNTANVGGGAVCLYENKSSALLDVDLVNNHIVNNEAPSGSVLYYDNGDIKLQNTVMWEVVENKSATVRKFVDGVKEENLKSASSYSIQYCAMQGIPETDGNFNLADNNTDADGPNFVQPTSFVGVPENDEEGQEIENADWSLLLASPLIGIANKSYLPEGITADFAGNPRILGGLDMGAFENQTASSVSTIKTASPSLFYPNPCQDYLYFENPCEINQVEIINQFGQVVCYPKEIEGGIDVKGLAPGLYFVRLYGDGIENNIQKIIKR